MTLKEALESKRTFRRPHDTTWYGQVEMFELPAESLWLVEGLDPTVQGLRCRRIEVADLTAEDFEVGA